MRWKFWRQASGVDVELVQLERRVRRMDAMTRAVILMHRLDSLGYDEIAERLGIAVGFPFAQRRDLPPEEARAEARQHFEKWLPSADAFLASARFLTDRGDENEAAFNFHHSAERFYHCALLVLTLYSPKSHKLNFLRSHAEEMAPELIAAWPRADKFSRRSFDLLRQAYVNARYSPHYEVSDAELRWLAERVAELQSLVKAVCEHRLAAD